MGGRRCRGSFFSFSFFFPSSFLLVTLARETEGALGRRQVLVHQAGSTNMHYYLHYGKVRCRLAGPEVQGTPGRPGSSPATCTTIAVVVQLEAPIATGSMCSPGRGGDAGVSPPLMPKYDRYLLHYLSVRSALRYGVRLRSVPTYLPSCIRRPAITCGTKCLAPYLPYLTMHRLRYVGWY